MSLDVCFVMSFVTNVKFIYITRVYNTEKLVDKQSEIIAEIKVVDGETQKV